MRARGLGAERQSPIAPSADVEREEREDAVAGLMSQGIADGVDPEDIPVDGYHVEYVLPALDEGPTDLLRFEYCRSRRRGTVSQPGPLPYFGPLTIITVDPQLADWPHRCVECGSREHCGKDCHDRH
jgi:hypothetical protein